MKLITLIILVTFQTISYADDTEISKEDYAAIQKACSYYQGMTGVACLIDNVNKRKYGDDMEVIIAEVCDFLKEDNQRYQKCFFGSLPDSEIPVGFPAPIQNLCEKRFDRLNKYTKYKVNRAVLCKDPKLQRDDICLLDLSSSKNSILDISHIMSGSNNVLRFSANTRTGRNLNEHRSAPQVRVIRNNNSQVFISYFYKANIWDKGYLYKYNFNLNDMRLLNNMNGTKYEYTCEEVH